MSCCAESITVFTNELITQVEVPANIRDVNGTRPYVQVMYDMGDGMWFNGVMTQVQLIVLGGIPYVKIDHGAPSSGVIKMR